MFSFNTCFFISEIHPAVLNGKISSIKSLRSNTRISLCRFSRFLFYFVIIANAKTEKGKEIHYGNLHWALGLKVALHLPPFHLWLSEIGLKKTQPWN